MANSKKDRIKGSMRNWLSKVLRSPQKMKLDTPTPKVGLDNPIIMESASVVGKVEDPSREEDNNCAISCVSPKHGIPVLKGIQETENDQKLIEQRAEESASAIGVSDELQEMLADNRFQLILDALKRCGITTIDRLKSLQLWVFLNEHNLYPLKERILVYNYIQDHLDSESICKRDTVLRIDSEHDQEVMDDLDSIGETAEPALDDNDPIILARLELDAPEKTLISGSPHIGSVTTQNYESGDLIVDSENEENNDSASTPYYVRYSLERSAYKSYHTHYCGFSVRVYNRLISNGIENVATLLEQTDTTMLAIKGFGATSLRELHSFFEGLANAVITEEHPKSTHFKRTTELDPFIDDLRNGDFSFLDNMEFSKEALRVIQEFRDAHDLIDPELLASVTKGESGVWSIITMLREFISEHEKEDACRAVLKKIPFNRLCLPVETVFSAYSNNEEVILFLAEHSHTGASLEQFIYSNADLIISNNTRLRNFLRWCTYNTSEELKEFFDKLLAKGHHRRLFSGRVRGETLAQLGDEFVLTRERIRQIESKIVRTSRTWFLRNRIAYKLFLDLGFDSRLSSTEIINHVGLYGPETVAILKECNGEGIYYNKKLDLFSLGERIDESTIQDYIDSLPEVFTVDKLDGILGNGIKKTGFSEKQLLIVFNDSYRRSGNVFHRSKSPLASMYGEIMKKYYPKGIHIDDKEIARFRKLVQKEYGIDLTDKNNHAISSIIIRISILCGRGKYRLKSDKPYLSKKLAKRIRTFVESSETPILLLSSVFSEFEDDLRAEGVNNRYHLQGILKELFGDVWYVKRDYVTTDPSSTSIYDAVVNYIERATSPVSKEEIMQKFPGITDVIINLAITGSDTINLFGTYINAALLTLSDKDINYFHMKLEDNLSKDKICSAKDLYSKILSERPGLLSRNYITAGFGLFSVLEYLFRDDYHFSRPFIAKEGAEIKRVTSVLREMVKEADLIEISEIISFASEHNYQIQNILDFADSCNSTHLMINAQELASFKYIGINKKIADQIEQLVVSEVIEAMPISGLTCIKRFPKINVEWNAWLIRSVLKKWSKSIVVGTSKSSFKNAYPIIALAGMPMKVEYDKSISHDGKLLVPDNLDNIEDLIADYISVELEDIDEL